MGTIIGRCSSSPYAEQNANPNPNNYKIIKTWSIGRHLAVHVNYPDTKNFEGDKILVYAFINTEEELLRQTQARIDPHFSRNGVSPIARFSSCNFGLNMALQFLKFLDEKVDICKK
jgi:hypothetical protein